MQKLSVTLDKGNAVIKRADGLRLSADCHGVGAHSAHELLGSALGSCIAASLAPLIERHALDATALEIQLRAVAEDASGGFDVHVLLPACERPVQLALQRAAERCPVRRALTAPVHFSWLAREQR